MKIETCYKLSILKKVKKELEEILPENQYVHINDNFFILIYRGISLTKKTYYRKELSAKIYYSQNSASEIELYNPKLFNILKNFGIKHKIKKLTKYYED